MKSPKKRVINRPISAKEQAAMLSYVSDAIIGYDNNLIITFWNQAAEKIYGYSATEALGQSSGFLKPSYNISREHLMDTVLKERHLEIESSRQTKDGRQIFIETHVISLTDAEGKNTGFIALDRDITQRKREEESLREARDYLDNLFNYANAPIIVWNPQFEITRFNHAFEHLTGFSAKEALGKKLDILFPDESRDMSMDLIRKTSSGERWESVEIPIRHRDGSVRIVLWNSSTVYGPDQITAIATIAQGHDITERKKAEADLAKLNRELRAISDCNKALVHLTNINVLFNEVCRVMCQVVGYRMAWIGIIEHDEAKTVRPVAWYGANSGYLEKSNITWADTERGRGPTGVAARTGKTDFCQDFVTNLQAAPWREEALARGFRSSIALPLFDNKGNTFAVFSVYASEPNGFTPQEVRLLEELAGDLSFGVMVLHAREEQAKAEAALRETRDYLDNLFNYANAPIIVWNPQFEITRFNHAFEHLTGFSSKEALGKKLEILFPDGSRDMSMDLIRKTSSGERWESVEIPIRHRDGTMRIVLWNSATIYGLDRKTAIATIAQGQDITRRKKAEVDLKESEGKFRTVLENFQDGISMLDLATDRYVFMSPAQLALTEFSEQELKNVTGGQVYERIHPDDRDILRKHQQRIITGENLNEPVEYRWKVKSGEYRWFSDRRKLVRDEAGRPSALVSVSRDITESKQLLERLAAQERLAYLGRMAGTIAHEVRNPLAVIDSSAYYLERQLSDADEKVKSHIQRMRNGVSRASAIIEKLLEMSRMRQPQLTKINLNTFIAKIILQANIPPSVKVSFPHCPNIIEIQADEEQLGMALGNLIRNAVEAMENSGTLTIGLSKVNNVVEILVADTGPGIPESNMPRMFEPLFTTKSGGVGFGLALVKTVVERHNGRISVKSVPGKGAKFTIYLTQSPGPGV